MGQDQVGTPEVGHTPGPWKIHTPDSIVLGPKPANMDFLIEAGPGDWGGFYVVEHNTINRHTMKHVDPMADARLIAAAPDLLAACQALADLDLVDECELSKGGSAITISTVIKDLNELTRVQLILRAAIKKATGKEVPQ